MAFIVTKLKYKDHSILKLLRPFSKTCSDKVWIQNRKILSCTNSCKLLFNGKLILCEAQVMYKHTSSKRGQRKNVDEDSDEDDEDDDQIEGKDITTKTITLGSLRTDLILKTGLGIARNKIEQLFYESRIRVNGMKIPKKSHHVCVGDEVDLIKGTSPKNPSYLIVARIELLRAAGSEDGEGIEVKIRRHKSLVIENYGNSQSGDAWKMSET